MSVASLTYIVGLCLHIVAAVIWVGGMFFAYVILRPATGPLEPPLRLPLWLRVFGMFFPIVWAAVIALLISGYVMIFRVWGGFAHVGMHVHIMQVIGIIMVLVFPHLFFAPWKRFRNAVSAGDFSAAATQLAQIRSFVLFNLVLGLVTVVIGATGRVWG